MTSFPPSRATRQQHLTTLAVALCALALAVSLGLGYRLLRQQRQAQRGVLVEALPGPPVPTESLYGVNAALEQYASPQELSRALAAVQTGGFGWVRQHFPWADIEPAPGQFDWAPWDRIVAAAGRQGLALIAVLDTSPAWAQRPIDRDNRYAAPQYVSTYGLFVRAFAQRYGPHIACYEVWDQPNLSAHWGYGPVDAAAYVRLLEVAAKELRGADPGAVVVAAGLAPTTENSGRNQNEVLFLRGMYDAGAKGLFDVLAAKPYGFWSGAEDRRVDMQVLNFSRAILLREELVRRGDAQVPIWAVEFGWNALPVGWQGRPSPWGSDDVAKQADRVARAVLRARTEWAWMGPMLWAQLQPAVPLDDPLWGFALLDPEGQPRLFYQALQEVMQQSVDRVRPELTMYCAQLSLIAVVLPLAVGAMVVLWPRSAWPLWLERAALAYRSLPEWQQWAAMGLALAAYRFLPATLPSLTALALAAWLMCWRLDIGLAYAVFSVPFFLSPKEIFGKSFSMVETLVILCAITWLWSWWRQEVWGGNLRASLLHLRERLPASLSSLTALDKSVVAFVALAVLSLAVSSNLGVSIRELRVIVIEPALLYFLLRVARLDERQLVRLTHALLLAGVAVALYGLYQYFVSGDVIVAEGVRRIRGVYASPNNLSLLLGRLIPLAVAGLLLSKGHRRWAHALALAPLLLVLFLTYSRGGWLLSLPAGLLAIGLLRGRRSTLWAAGAILLCLLLLLPFVGTERFVSLFNAQEGTTFYRLSLWRATVDMIRDHPLTGVGLDNFLYQYPNYMLREAWQEPDLSHPHNIILDFWTRLGLGGVFVLLALVWAFMRRALPLYHRLPDGERRAIILGWIASMASMWAHGLIDNSYFLVDLAFVFFLGLGTVQALDRRARESVPGVG